jgi:hypothetical protein
MRARAIATGMSLRADLVTAEVLGALGEAGVRAMLVRGPAIARWLYDDEGARSYGDVDLLVAPDDVSRAEQVLAELGFTDQTVEGLLSEDRPTHAHPWGRERDGASVDLHSTLVGIGAKGGVWDTFAGHETDSIEVAGTRVEIPAPAGRALVVALHAAQHGSRVEKPLVDLQRALARVGDPVWDDAASLARRLDATDAFAAGLRLLPEGRALARRLGLPEWSSTETVLRATTPPATALGFEWIARAPGVGPKLRLARSKLAPSAAFMRAWSPLARRGRIGLGAAYVWRVAWLAWNAPRGFRAWRRARG